MGEERKKTRGNTKLTRIGKQCDDDSGITEEQFDEALRRVIRKPSEKPSDSAKSQT